MVSLQLHCKCDRLFVDSGLRRSFRYCPLLSTGAQRGHGTFLRATPHDIADIAQAADVLLQHGPHAFSTPPLVPPEGGPQHSTHEEISCTLSGLDNVMCVIEEVPDDDQLSASTSSSSSMDALIADRGLLSLLIKNALLVSPFFFWGTSMVAMKSVVPHTTPLLLGALRLLPAGVVLVGWAAASGRAQPSTLKAWAWVLAFALIDAAAFQGFLAEGLTRTSAGLGSVIIDSQPLSVAVLAALLFGERLSGVGVAGLLLGVLGLGLLEVPADSLAEGAAMILSGAWRPEALAMGLGGAGAGAAAGSEGGLMDRGEFWMLLAAQSMAVGTVMVRYVTRHVDPVMATGWHMVIGGAVLAAAAALHDGAAVADAANPAAALASQLSHLTQEDMLSMSYVSLMGGAVSYGVFFWNATHGSLTSLSSLTFLTPVFASVAGYMALGEVLSPMQLMGGMVTLASVGLINYRPRTPQVNGTGTLVQGKDTK